MVDKDYGNILDEENEVFGLYGTSEIVKNTLRYLVDQEKVQKEKLVTDSYGTSIEKTIGVNIHELQYDVDYTKVKSYGINIVRNSLAWDLIEKVKGVYNFTPNEINYDQLIQTFTDNGIKPYITLMPSNLLYTSKIFGALDTEEKRQAYANWAAACANQYKNKGIYWEIYNEPNTEWGWSPQTNSAYHYTELVKKTSTLIKQYDPSGLVVAPALFGPDLFKGERYWRYWLENTFKNG
ncbi:family 1 glycosylhydrolase, partial [Priestia flexa]|uniref:family 1 glycosylhydrolase n=1 Tax=Priestia flexa TaxID=86664 RepID=UPI000473FE00